MSMPLFSKIFILILPFFFAGCSHTPPGNYDALNRWMQENGKLKVLSTTQMIDELVRGIGAARVDHIALIGPDLDPHSYELVKGDEEKFSLAHVVFYNGLGLEHGASLAYRLQVLPTAFPVGERVKESRFDALITHDAQMDPHIWMDISLWAVAAQEVERVLVEADPQGAEYYHAKGKEFNEELLKAHEELLRSLNEIPESLRYLVTSHDAFFYFTRAYLATHKERGDESWRKRCSAPEGLAPDGQLSTQHLAEVIAFLKRHDVQVVFPESNVNPDSLKKIAECCKAEGLKLRLSDKTLYADAMGGAGSDGETYIKMVKHNAEAIKEELLCRE